MRYLMLPDLKLGLNNLFDNSSENKRLMLFRNSKTSAIYEPILRKQQESINALPAQLTGRALTEQMTEADRMHDSFAAAFWMMTEAYLRLPTLPETRRRQLQTLRKELLSEGLSELKRSYADQASKAIERLPRLEGLQEILQSFPLADNQTLYDWVKTYLDNGKLLDDLMSERAREEAIQESEREQAGVLRSVTIRHLSSCRATLGDEIATDLSLPRNLDSQIFGYFDDLHEQRSNASRLGGRTQTDKIDEPQNATAENASLPIPDKNLSDIYE